MTLVKVARPRINRSFDNMLNNFFEDMNFDYLVLNRMISLYQ